MQFVHRVRFPTIKQIIALGSTRTGVIALTSGGSTLVRMLSSIVLTRILSPESFGIVGIVGSIFFVITMLTDLGFQAYLVPHERGDDRHFRDVIWTVHAVRGVVLAGVAALISPIVAQVLGKPQLTLPLAIASVTFIFYGFTSFSLITALRNHGARKLAILDFIIQIGQTITCIMFALWLRNVWAMIIAMIVQSALRMALSYICFADSKHTFAREDKIYKDFLRFSRLILASSVTTLMILQTDKLVLARLFSLEQFGLYAIALSLASAPMYIGDAYMTTVIFPIYAQGWRTDPIGLSHAYYRVRRTISLLFALGCGLIIGGANFLIILLYDPRYEGAALWLSILMIGVALRFPNVAAGQLMTAKGDIKSLLHLNMTRLAWFAAAIPVAYMTFGALGVVIAVGVVEVPAMIFSWLYLRRAGMLSVRQEISFIVAVGIGAALSYGITSELLGLLRL